MTKKIISSSILSAAALSLSVSSVFAHSTVGPAEVGIAIRQDFSVGVPNEKEIPTIEVRIVLPDGLDSVTPYVKQGWEITSKKSDEGEDAKVTEITWTGGQIADGLRDTFIFRAMTPSEPTTLVWKVYQTYSDGTVVSWDQDVSDDISEEEEMALQEKGMGPNSKTSVVDDIATKAETESRSGLDKYTTWVAYAALLLAAASLALGLRNNMPSKQ